MATTNGEYETNDVLASKELLEEECDLKRKRRNLASEYHSILEQKENRLNCPNQRLSVIAILGLVVSGLSASLLVMGRGFFGKQRRQLYFSSTNDTQGQVVSSFRILQLADLHIGEDEDTEWGPEQDRKTWIALDRILSHEQPHLIVLSGDQLTANNMDANATAYYKMLCKKLSTYQVPWAMIFGNHDDAPFEQLAQDGNSSHIRRFPAKTSRRDLLRVDQSFPLSMTAGSLQQLDDSGLINFALDIHLPGGLIGAQLLFLDTGGGSFPQSIEESQIQWLQNQKISEVPWVMFAHIPTKDFTYHESCHGMQEEGVAHVHTDAGLVSAISSLGNVHFLAVGHNHGNDYCCETSSSSILHLCFGRHSGYGGYGRWDRGARVYELKYSTDQSFQWRSWVRMENGSILDEFIPKAKIRH